MVELLMVVGVLAIVAAMAIPPYMNYLRNYRVRNDANNIVSLTTVARMRAGATFGRTAVSCNPQSAPPVCKVYTLSATSGNICDLSVWTQELQQYAFSPTVKFGIPASATNGVAGQSLTTPTQVGSTAQGTSYTFYFNSRGWPVNCANGGIVRDYAMYLQDAPGVFSAAVGIDTSGRGQVYLLSGSSYWVIKD
jgi:Tfp pilus assembly protein FimT